MMSWSNFYALAGKRTNVCWIPHLAGDYVWAIVDGENVRYVSANEMRELHNLQEFDEYLSDAAFLLQKRVHWCSFAPVIFNGIIASTSRTFCIFDIVPIPSFSHIPLLTRYQYMRRMNVPIWCFGQNVGKISILPHKALYKNPHELARCARQRGHLGIMCRLWNRPYQHRQVLDWCPHRTM